MSDYRVGVSCFAVRYVVLTVCMHFFGLCFMTRLNCGIHLHLKSMWKYAHCLLAFSFSLHELLSPPLCDAVILVAHHAAHLSLRDMHFILVFILKFKKNMWMNEMFHINGVASGAFTPPNIISSHANLDTIWMNRTFVIPNQNTFFMILFVACNRNAFAIWDLYNFFSTFKVFYDFYYLWFSFIQAKLMFERVWVITNNYFCVFLCIFLFKLPLIWFVVLQRRLLHLFRFHWELNRRFELMSCEWNVRVTHQLFGW